jgi:hypothetical protein
VNAHAASAERASAYVVERVRRASGSRWRQGRWAPPFVCTSRGDATRVVAEWRLHRVERVVAHALVTWANGARDVDLITHVPSAREVLALQARGRRCVSLLDDDVATAPHADGLAFCLHDLCHLEKFVDPQHHRAQVGFFAMVERAMATGAWRDLERGFDDAWVRDRDHVLADMNGSPIFLFAALKMKLKMATRRRVGGACAGPLDDRERRAFDDALDLLLDALGFDGSLCADARDVSTRRDAPDAAVRLCEHFERLGADALARATSAPSSAA